MTEYWWTSMIKEGYLNTSFPSPYIFNPCILWLMQSSPGCCKATYSLRMIWKKTFVKLGFMTFHPRPVRSSFIFVDCVPKENVSVNVKFFEASPFDVGAKGKGYLNSIMMMKWKLDEDGQGYFFSSSFFVCTKIFCFIFSHFLLINWSI